MKDLKATLIAHLISGEIPRFSAITDDEYEEAIRINEINRKGYTDITITKANYMEHPGNVIHIKGVGYCYVKLLEDKGVDCRTRLKLIDDR